MADETWQQIRTIFDEALRRKPEEREEFVRQACGENKSLFAEVESLLSSLNSAENFLETPVTTKVAGALNFTKTKRLEGGKCFGHYEIVEQIGSGGMGEIYLALDKKLDRKIAIKILNERFSQDESNLKRFIQEAKSASALNHPNILVVHEIGQSENFHYIVSEFIKGKTLREVLKESSLKLSEILDISIQIAAALKVAHEAHLVHRDIKPENIMIRPDGYVKILDFGLAKLVERKNESILGFEDETAKTNQTAKGVILGTVNYMSPEQAKGKSVDERTDVFSFGVVLYEMIAGRTPFAADSAAETFANLINSEPKPISNFAAAPADLQRIVSKLLRKNRDERYQTMREALADLKNLQLNLPSRTTTFPDANSHFTGGRIGDSALDWQSERREDYAAKTLVPTNIRRPAVSERSILFGREREISEIQKLLWGEQTQLVVLTGAGGSGKTSVARVVAENCLSRFADGVFFVELAAIFNPDLLAGAIAQTLDVKESGKAMLVENLKTFLGERRILLVLDNFEQIASAAPLVSEILAAAPHLKVLITSRVALRLKIENEIVVPPLETLPRDSAISAEKLKESSSVQMFAARARSAKPGFVLSDENATVIAEICARLDGLPLAIELAAARTKLLKPAEILQRLENRLEILTDRSGGVPARQKTMRDAIAWSYGLLAEPEKILLKRLSVFAGGFTVEAAEAISRKEGGTAEILDGLETLVENHLLQQIESQEAMRLVPLETIREFAAAELAADTREHAAMRRRHAEFFLAFARRSEYKIFGAEQTATLNLLEAERDNFRTALDWSSKAGDVIYLKLAAALAPLWTFRGFLGEGVETVSHALEKNSNATTAARVKALASLGQLIWHGGDYVRAIEVCEDALPLARRIDYKIACARLLQILGMSYWWQYANEPKATKYLEESLQLSRELDYEMGVVIALVVLAAIHQTYDRAAQAAELLDESERVAKRMNNALALSLAYVNSGRLAVYQGELERAKTLCRKGLKLREEMSDRWGLVQCLEPLAAIAVKQGDARRAAVMLGAIDVLLETVGAQPPLIFRADHEHNVATARDALDENDFAEAFAEGRGLTVNEVVNLALDESANQNDYAETLTTNAHFLGSEKRAATTARTLAGVSQPIKRRQLLAALVLIGLLVGAAAALGFYFYATKTAAVGDKKSIVVLPLKPINTANRDEIYEIGIADSLIHRLGLMNGLIVRPLSAVRKYADVEQDPIAAGREQRVDYVLASNYQLADGKIRITAQLLDVATGQIEETKILEKDSANIFAMQDAIAGEIGNILLTHFATTSSNQKLRGGTENVEAYRLYLQAMYLYSKRTPRASEKAVELLEQAVHRDPNYALAWAGKAHAHRFRGNLGRDTNTHEEYQNSIRAIKEALLLDKDLSEAYSALCENKYYYEWDFAGAERECRRAISLDPNSSLAHEIYGRFLFGRGRFDEAISEIKTAIALDPTSLFNQRNLGIALYYAGRYEDAAEQFEQVIETDENFSSAYMWLRNALEMQGKYPEAFEWFIKSQVVFGVDGQTLQFYKTVYQTSGYQSVLSEYVKKFDKNSINQYYIGAILNAQIGNKEKAFEYLEKSYQRREWGMNTLSVEPLLIPLRNDPRFIELVRRIESN